MRKKEKRRMFFFNISLIFLLFFWNIFQKPFMQSQKMFTSGWQTPIDEVDAAARCVWERRVREFVRESFIISQNFGFDFCWGKWASLSIWQILQGISLAGLCIKSFTFSFYFRITKKQSGDFFFMKHSRKKHSKSNFESAKERFIRLKQSQ